MLQIMDAQNLITEERSLDSFPCGFKLAWELAYELNHFKMDRHPFPSEKGCLIFMKIGVGCCLKVLQLSCLWRLVCFSRCINEAACPIGKSSAGKMSDSSWKWFRGHMRLLLEQPYTERQRLRMLKETAQHRFEVDNIEYNFDNRRGINLLVNTEQLIGTSADSAPRLQ